jgi:hypothetical protein
MMLTLLCFTNPTRPTPLRCAKPNFFFLRQRARTKGQKIKSSSLGFPAFVFCWFLPSFLFDLRGISVGAFLPLKAQSKLLRTAPHCAPVAQIEDRSRCVA